MLDYKQALDVFIDMQKHIQARHQYVFDFFKITNVRVETLRGKTDYIVPIVDIETKDRGFIPTLPFDVHYPTLRNAILDNATETDTCTVVHNGLPERIIKLDSTSSNLNIIDSLNAVGLKRFTRYLKGDYSIFPTNDTDLISSYIMDNIERWHMRTGQPKATQFVKEEIDVSMYLGHKFVVYRDWNGNTSMIEYVIDEHGTFHWVNTYRAVDEKAEKERIGNLTLLAAVRLAIDSRCKVFNMGIDTFDYKTMWSKDTIFAKGLYYKGS